MFTSRFLHVGGVVFISAILIACPASAKRYSRHQTTRPTGESQNENWCENKGGNVSPDLQIGACTALIRSGRLSRQNLSLAFTYRCNAYLGLKDYDHALADCSEAIHLEPKAYTYNNRGPIYVYKGDYQKAIDDFTKAIKLKRDFSLAYNNRASAYERLNDLSDAINDYTKAIKINPFPKITGNTIVSPDDNRTQHIDVYLNRGNAYYLMHDYVHAAADYTEAIRAEPKNAFAYLNRGIAYEYEKKYDQAIADYDMAIKLNPKYAAAYNNRCATYFDEKKYAQATVDCTKAIKLNPKFTLAYSNRAAAYEKQKDYGHAIADREAALKLEPKNASFSYYLGNDYRSSHQYDQAIASYSKAISLQPNLAKAYLSRAGLYIVSGHGKAALADLDQVNKLNPGLIGDGWYVLSPEQQHASVLADLPKLNLDAVPLVDVTYAAVPKPSAPRAQDAASTSSAAASEAPLTASGPGLVISKDGYLLAAYPLIDGAQKIRVTFKTGERYPADVVGSDSVSGLALLKIEAKNKTFAPATLASKQPEEGSIVILCLPPPLSDRKVVPGLVSDPTFDATRNGLGLSKYIRVETFGLGLKSQGPIFNQSGEVVGFATPQTRFGWSSYLALPTPAIANVISQLRAHGSVARGWLGVTVSNVTAKLAAKEDLGQPKGALITQVLPGGPASKHGGLLKKGDIILQVHGSDVANGTDLARKIAGISPHSWAIMRICRNGTEEFVAVSLGTRPAAPEQANALARPYLRRANELIASGHRAAALPFFTDAMSLDPSSVAALDGRAGAEMVLPNGDAKAISDFTKALKLNPKDTGDYMNRGLAYLRDGNSSKAEADFGMLIEFYPNEPGGYINRASAYLHEKDYEKAIADLRKSLSLARTDKDTNRIAYEGLGDAYIGEGKSTIAIDYYSKAIGFGPDDVDLYTKRGKAYYQNDQYSLAETDFSKVINTIPSDELNGNMPAPFVEFFEKFGADPAVFENRGMAFLKMGDLKKAIKDFDTALMRDSKRPISLYGRGVAENKQLKGSGDSDLAAAKAIAPDIAIRFAHYGAQ